MRGGKKKEIKINRARAPRPAPRPHPPRPAPCIAHPCQRVVFRAFESRTAAPRVSFTVQPLRSEFPSSAMQSCASETAASELAGAGGNESASVSKPSTTPALLRR